MTKKIAFACDHRGFEVKTQIMAHLEAKGYKVVDCGTHSGESCDYPDFMIAAASKVASGECERAIGVCYTGIGSSIVANKVAGVRASLCQTVKEAELTRAHNDSNMLILGSGVVNPDILLKLIDTWLETAFEGGRHERRVNKIKDYESKFCG
ncbi:MAG: ribose 5-phosphate isomerase B [Candidatus Omnitrophota bacterium]|nr:ribose 5-phosphate isomerase B [Candidatus Omnitrophota bacterium]